MTLAVLHVIGRMDECAGTTVFCREIAERTARAGARVGVVTVFPATADTLPKEPVRTFAVPPRGGGFPGPRWIVDARRVLDAACSAMEPSVVHVHGLWDPVAHLGVALARRRRLPLVLSPHGMLAPRALRHHALRKKIAWVVYQRADLGAASLVHATSQLEHDQLRAFGVKKPIAIVPLGVDVQERAARVGSPQRRVLFLSRIHPHKGLLDLVEAWSQVRPVDWKVVVAGPDQRGFLGLVKRRVRERGLGEDFEFW